MATIFFIGAPGNMTEPAFFGFRDFFPGDTLLASVTPPDRLSLQDNVSGSYVVFHGDIQGVSSVNNVPVTAIEVFESFGSQLMGWNGDGVRLGQFISNPASN